MVATERQVSYIRILCEKIGLNSEQFISKSLTKGQASKVISSLEELRRFIDKIPRAFTEEERKRIYEELKKTLDELTLPDEVKQDILSLKYSSLFWIDFEDLEKLKDILPVPDTQGQNPKFFIYLYAIKDGKIEFLSYFKGKEWMKVDFLTSNYKFLKNSLS